MSFHINNDTSDKTELKCFKHCQKRENKKLLNRKFCFFQHLIFKKKYKNIIKKIVNFTPRHTYFFNTTVFIIICSEAKYFIS